MKVIYRNISRCPSTKPSLEGYQKVNGVFMHIYSPPENTHAEHNTKKRGLKASRGDLYSHLEAKNGRKRSQAPRGEGGRRRRRSRRQSTRPRRACRCTCPDRVLEVEDPREGLVNWGHAEVTHDERRRGCAATGVWKQKKVKVNPKPTRGNFLGARKMAPLTASGFLTE